METASYSKHIQNSRLVDVVYGNIKRYVPGNITVPIKPNNIAVRDIFIKLITGLPEKYGILKGLDYQNAYSVLYVDIPLKLLLDKRGMVKVDKSFYDDYWNNINGDILFTSTDIVKCKEDKRNFILEQLITDIGYRIFAMDIHNNIILPVDGEGDFIDLEKLYVRFFVPEEDELYSRYGIFTYPENTVTKQASDEDDTEEIEIGETTEFTIDKIFEDSRFPDNCKSLTMVMDNMIENYISLDDIFVDGPSPNFLSPTDSAFILDSYVRTLLDIDQTQGGKYLTKPIDDDFKLALTDIQLREFNTIIENSGRINFNKECENYLEKFDDFAQYMISDICELMKKVIEIKLSNFSNIIWIFHLDFDVKVDNSIDIGRIIKFDYNKTDNKVLISVKPFNI